MRAEESEAVVENSKLPLMEEQATRAAGARRGLKLMDESPAPDKGGKNRMQAPPKPRAAAKKAGAKKAAARPQGDQEERRGARARAEEKQGSYLRMRVRVENGEMSVVDMKEVEGPLSQRESLPSGFAYEVTLNQRQLAVGLVPDIGVWRGLPDPREDAPVEMRGHHITPQASVEFNVRVPREGLSLSALQKTEIALYQVKKDVSDQPIAARALSTAFSEELREVARLKGIKVADLPQAAQNEVKRAFK